MSNIFKANSRFAILSEETNDDKKKNEKKNEKRNDNLKNEKRNDEKRNENLKERQLRRFSCLKIFFNYLCDNNSIFIVQQVCFIE